MVSRAVGELVAKEAVEKEFDTVASKEISLVVQLLVALKVYLAAALMAGEMASEKVVLSDVVETVASWVEWKVLDLVGKMASRMARVEAE